LKHVNIVDDGQAAIVGGEIISQDLANALGATGYATPFGNSASVGYVGWATHGGYGPFTGIFVLGVDQIVGARVVNYQGSVIDADDELLYGIRGAGSAFGVIVSLKIRVYKLEKVHQYCDCEHWLTSFFRFWLAVSYIPLDQWTQYSLASFNDTRNWLTAEFPTNSTLTLA
jgi:FAD/FMN-containing dehydrogenase